MSFQIRNYTDADFEMIQGWWTKQNEVPPTKEMLPPDTTFICEYEGVPLVSITVYLTNSKEFCMLDNFVGNPEFPGEKRKEASGRIIGWSEVFAMTLGYKSMMCLAMKDKLKEYYTTFGYTKRFDNVATFNKALNV